MGVLQWFGKQRQWRQEHIAAFAAVAGMQSDGLTLFQHRSLVALSGIVAPESFRRVAMNSEPGVYLLAPIGTKGRELYIYPNEASIFGTKPHAWFEEWDYRTPEDLISALVAECTAGAV